MNRADALKILRLSEASDGHAVEQSYWSLVRRAQSNTSARAQLEIERLNEAYALLAPAPEPMHRAALRSQPMGANPPAAPLFLGDAALDWFGAEAGRVRRRWAGRNVEIAMICGPGLVLVVLAFMAGAAVIPTLVCLAVIIAGVWAPWRKAPPAK